VTLLLLRCQVRMDMKYERVFIRGVAQSLPSGCEWWLVGIRKLGESALQLLLTPSEPAPLRGASLGSLGNSSGSGSFSAAAGNAVAQLRQQQQQDDDDDDAGLFAAAAAAAVARRRCSVGGGEEVDDDFADLGDAEAQQDSVSAELAGLLQDDDDDEKQQSDRAAAPVGGGAEQEGCLYPVVSWTRLVEAVCTAAVCASRKGVQISAAADGVCLT
jgi:hypothetical protein